MRELEYLSIIEKNLSDTSYLGNDCAILKEFGLCITQDTLVEDVHFILSTTTPYDLAQKSVNINISDLAATLAQPLYITISLSLPNFLNQNFINEFYKGINDCCNKFKIKVVGGDLTASEKLIISICAIGKKNPDIDVSRSFAQPEDIILTTGYHGDSAGGLNLILNKKENPQYLINKHLLPNAQIEKSKHLAFIAQKAGIKKLAMMDTSDGLGDAVYKISKASGFMLQLNQIPASDILKSTFPNKWKDLAMWGGEDFELLFCIPQDVYDLLDKSQFYKIGTVLNQPISDCMLTEFENKSFKHFN